MPILLHLVRHGQTSWNVDRRIQGQSESDLDQTGRNQAIAVGDRLRTLPFIAIHCSTSVRTRQTLELLLADVQHPVTYRDDLREMCFGEWEGQLWSDIEQAHPEMVMRFREGSSDYSVPGAENHKQLQDRGVVAIEDILSAYEGCDGDILVVSHGALLKRILAAYTGIDLAVRPDLPPLHNCSHSTIEADGRQRHVITVAGEPIENTGWVVKVKTLPDI